MVSMAGTETRREAGTLSVADAERLAEIMQALASPVRLRILSALSVQPSTVTDLSDFRLDAARALGLDAERADAPRDSTFTVLLECSGAPAALSGGMRRLDRAGVRIGAREVVDGVFRRTRAQRHRDDKPEPQPRGQARAHSPALMHAAS